MGEEAEQTVPRRRMTAAQREQQLLRAAVTAFAQGGYTGTTTDQVARIAGVSQPYVLRLFGSKQALFLAAYQHAGSRIQDAFRAAATTLPPGAEVPDGWPRWVVHTCSWPATTSCCSSCSTASWPPPTRHSVRPCAAA